MITTVLAFMLALGVLIVIHEFGHYRVARACGVKVLEFSLGFGQVLWRWQREPGSTEFMVRALPLGGYVRMLDEREGPVPEADRSLALGAKPLWCRTAIVLAGPMANLLLAVLLFGAVHWIGTEQQKALLGAPLPGSVAERAGLRSGDWVREVSVDGSQWEPVMSMIDLNWRVTQAILRPNVFQLRVTDASGRAERTVLIDAHEFEDQELDSAAMRKLGVSVWRDAVAAAVPDGPAARAGLQVGDRVLRVGEVPVVDAAQLESLIRAHGVDAGPMVWHVQRGLQTLTLSITPVLDPRSMVARVSVYLGTAPEMVLVRYGPLESLQQAVQNTWDQSALTLTMLGRMVVGEASIKNLSGTLSIADYAGQSARMGLTAYLGFLAVLSVGLGVFNLLPLPILDGGHLMYYLFEALTGRPVPELWLGRLQRVGLIILFLVMSLALFNDVTRLLGLH